MHRIFRSYVTDFAAAAAAALFSIHAFCAALWMRIKFQLDENKVCCARRVGFFHSRHFVITVYELLLWNCCCCGWKDEKANEASMPSEQMCYCCYRFLLFCAWREHVSGVYLRAVCFYFVPIHIHFNRHSNTRCTYLSYILFDWIEMKCSLQTNVREIVPKTFSIDSMCVCCVFARPKMEYWCGCWAMVASWRLLLICSNAILFKVCNWIQSEKNDGFIFHDNEMLLKIEAFSSVKWSLDWWSWQKKSKSNACIYYFFFYSNFIYSNHFGWSVCYNPLVIHNHHFEI